MRNTFIVFAKLLGLYALLRALDIVAPLGLLMWASQRWLEDLSAGLWWVLASVASFLFSLIIAALLIFKTEKVADWLKLKQVEGPSQARSTHQVLVIALALVGLYVLVVAIASLVAKVLEIIMSSGDRGVPQSVAFALMAALGLILVLKAEAVAALVGRKSQAEQQAPPPVGT